VPDEVSAFRGSEEIERKGDQVADVVKGPRTCGSDEGFEFREGQFNRIEIRAVGRQESELGAHGFDRRAHDGLFVDGEVVEHHHIAGAQRRHQDLLDIGEERRVVDRSVEHGRRPQTVETERCHHSMRLPMAARRVIAEAGPDRAAAVPPQQIGRHTAFVEKHILPRVPERLPLPPLSPRRGDVRPALLGGVYRFF